MGNRVKILLLLLWLLPAAYAQVADHSYLDEVRTGLQKKWPENRTINLVFHGHSVPSGYFNTPNVKTLQSYPQLTLQNVKSVYPNAVVNTITTAIGGENSEQGAIRLEKDVLIHNPDILFIDYALNDRALGLEKALKAWEKMIKAAQKRSIKVILLTPTPDTTENILDDNSPLAQHSCQIRELASKYKTGLIDSYAAFREKRQNGYDLKAYMSQSNHPNEKGHRIVAGLIAGYLLGEKEYKEYRLNKVRNILDKAADWQIMNFENQVVKGSQWANSHAYWAWTNATLYIGMAEWAALSNNTKYWDFLQTTGKKNTWKTGPSIYFADDLCIIQPYIQLYQKFKDPKMIEPSRQALDSIIQNPREASLEYYAKDSHSRWCWCDALFMAPTSFARMGKVTGDSKYFDFMDREFWISYDTLYCSSEKLFFRDTRYKTMREENGEKVFWGRGNGWVAGALTIIIENLPDNYPSRQRYIRLFGEMMERVAGLQDEKGFWHPSMLDYEAYPMPETSASGFFTYALWWGINQGYLNEQKYLPHAEKGWEALCSAVHDDGKLGYVQAIGADPKKVTSDDTEVYGVGAFLLAGKERYSYILKK